MGWFGVPLFQESFIFMSESMLSTRKFQRRGPGWYSLCQDNDSLKAENEELKREMADLRRKQAGILGLHGWSLWGSQPTTSLYTTRDGLDTVWNGFKAASLEDPLRPVHFGWLVQSFPPLLYFTSFFSYASGLLSDKLGCFHSSESLDPNIKYP